MSAIEKARPGIAHESGAWPGFFSVPLYVEAVASVKDELMSHQLKESIRPLRVEGFIGPHEGYQILSFRQIDDVVGIPGQHVHCLNLFPADGELQHFLGADLPLLDEAVA